MKDSNIKLTEWKNKHLFNLFPAKENYKIYSCNIPYNLTYMYIFALPHISFIAYTENRYKLITQATYRNTSLQVFE